MWKGLKSFINNMLRPSACFSLERESILATPGISVHGDVAVCAGRVSLSDWTVSYLSPVAELRTAASQFWPRELVCNFSVTVLLPLSFWNVSHQHPWLKFGIAASPSCLSALFQWLSGLFYPRSLFKCSHFLLSLYTFIWVYSATTISPTKDSSS